MPSVSKQFRDKRAMQHSYQVRLGRQWYQGRRVNPEAALIGLRSGYSTAEMAKRFWPDSTEADIYNAISLGRRREGSL